MSPKESELPSMAAMQTSPEAAAPGKPGKPLPWLIAPPTAWEAFRRDPVRTAAKLLYSKWLEYDNTRLQFPQDAIAVACVSDTHGKCPNIPAGDIFLHAGDLTETGSFSQVQNQLDWIKSLPHRHKVVIAGNHDIILDPAELDRSPHLANSKSPVHLNWGDIIYLDNSSVCLDFPNGRRLKIFGSPWTPQYGNWAFQYPPTRDIWTDAIPSDVDIVLTHGPAKGFLDQGGSGCEHLLREIWRKRPRLVVHGHIHSGYGQQNVTYTSFEAAYTDVLSKKRGVLAVGQMAIELVLETLLRLLRIPRWRDDSRHTTFINAAARIDRNAVETRPAVRVEI